jgi:hypothetical protein
MHGILAASHSMQLCETYSRLLPQAAQLARGASASFSGGLTKVAPQTTQWAFPRTDRLLVTREITSSSVRPPLGSKSRELGSARLVSVWLSASWAATISESS